MGMGIKSISSAFHVSRNTVRKYVRRYQESGLTLEQLLSMSEAKVQDMFLDECNRSRKASPRMEELEALIPDYVKRLSHKGVTVKSLHEEYLREHPDGYQYSNFKRAVRRYKYQSRAVGHVEHMAGDQMYIDYAGMAEFYDMAVFPARARRPKDKALVENAVKLMYRSVYADIEGLVFHDLSSLNEAIGTSLAVFNDRKMSGRDHSRRELFEEVEKDYLQPLPALRYQMKSRKSVTVLKNSYVVLNKHHYSVPAEYIGKRVDIIYDSETLQIFHGLKLATIHQRDDTPYAYTQKESHNLPGRHGSYEKDLEEIYERASAVDNILLTYLKEVAEQKKYLPQAFRTCRGIMSLEGKFGLDRLVAACACAAEGRLYGYNEVKEVLERGDDISFMPAEIDASISEYKPKEHRNIRGRDYYSDTNNQQMDINGNK